MIRTLLVVLILLASSPLSADHPWREIQQQLYLLGFYYTGPVDGTAGPRTDAAIRRFQRSLGANPTGILTEAQHALLQVSSLRVRRPRVWPVDESDRDAAFEATLRGLRAATRARDAQGVALFFADDAVLDFGGGAGPDELVARLESSSSGTNLWQELETVLEMGAVQTGDAVFCMPYVWCADRVAERVGTNDSAWVVAANAALLREPEAGAEPVEPLRYDVLEILGTEGDWARVRSLEGGDAWLHRSQYRTPYDYRILFNREDGSWRVTAFVAGD
jgi:peptidoglycan hydrolase-like protein with peptidoglycan-binding domain